METVIDIIQAEGHVALDVSLYTLLPIMVVTKKSGSQLGDPDRLTTAVLTLIASGNPPPQLLLGSDALKLVSVRMERLHKETEEWKAVTLSTDG